MPTRSRSAPSKASSPRMARSVIADDLAPSRPAKSASSSRHSTLMMVESMSATSSRLLRPSSGWTQQSSGCVGQRPRQGRARDRRQVVGLEDQVGDAVARPSGSRDRAARAALANASAQVDGRMASGCRAGATRVRTTSSMEPRIWLIAGPTASGKSALALRLARATGGEIVNADSMQLYARPAHPDRPALAGGGGRARRTTCSASPTPPTAGRSGAGCGRPRATLAEIAARGRPAIVVGGTGLYFRALTEGLAEIPPVPPTSARDGRGRLRRDGRGGLPRPPGRRSTRRPTARIAPGDRQRLVRAWEVVRRHRPAAQRLAGRRPSRRSRPAPGAPSCWSRRARRSTPAATRGWRRWSRPAPSTRSRALIARATSTRRCRR